MYIRMFAQILLPLSLWFVQASALCIIIGLNIFLYSFPLRRIGRAAAANSKTATRIYCKQLLLTVLKFVME